MKKYLWIGSLLAVLLIVAAQPAVSQIQKAKVTGGEVARF
jgi:hypothetical protein